MLVLLPSYIFFISSLSLGSSTFFYFMKNHISSIAWAGGKNIFSVSFRRVAATPPPPPHTHTPPILYIVTDFLHLRFILELSPLLLLHRVDRLLLFTLMWWTVILRSSSRARLWLLAGVGVKVCVGGNLGRKQHRAKPIRFYLGHCDLKAKRRITKPLLQ